MDDPVCGPAHLPLSENGAYVNVAVQQILGRLLARGAGRNQPGSATWWRDDALALLAPDCGGEERVQTIRGCLLVPSASFKPRICRRPDPYVD